MNSTDRKKQFYEAYWSIASQPVSAGDPTTRERQIMLMSALSMCVGQPAEGRLHGKVLDAGCGRGEFCGFMRECGYDVTGIDISNTAVEQARARFAGAVFHVASLEERLPFRDMEFDAIWCTEVLEHLFDVHAGLSELNRVLRIGGHLILTVPYHGVVKNLAIVLGGFERHFNPCISHIRFFTKHSLRDSLARAGFEAMQWGGVGRTWPLYKSFFVVARKVRSSGPAPQIIG